MPRRKLNKRVPPPPPDAHNYILVEAKEGPHWRRKRGTVKEAVINATLKKNTELVSITSAAAKRILAMLSGFTEELETGRFIARVSGRLMKAKNKAGKFTYSFMEDYEMQPFRPMYELFPLAPHAFVQKDEVVYTLGLHPHPVKRFIKSMTGYFFELVTISGDPSKSAKLRIQTDTSPVYSFTSKPPDRCILSLPLPNRQAPWMVFIKATCMEGDKPAKGDRHSGMKVVKTG